MNIFLLFTFFFLNPDISEHFNAKEYSIPEIRVEVEIKANGIVRIREYRTYRFEGSFSWADYKLPKRGFTDIKNFQVSGEGQFYINSNTGEQGTFSVSENDDAVQVKWNFNATDTERTFAVSYELEGALEVGPGWVEFFWNYLASGREKPTSRFEAAISLPDEIAKGLLHIWTRGGGENVTIDKSGGSVIVSATDISRKESVKIRMAFPSDVLDRSMVTVTNPDLTLEWIMEDEERYKMQQQALAEEESYFRSIVTPAAILIIFISTAVFILLYRKYSTRHSTATISAQETVMAPGKIKPAIIGTYLNARTPSSQHLLATLFDLADRGYFVIKEDVTEKSGLFSSDQPEFKVNRTQKTERNDLTEWEISLLEFANDRINEGHTTIKNLFKSGDSSVSKWYSGWVKMLTEDLESRNWIDKKSYTAVLFNIPLQLILLIAAIYFAVKAGTIAIVAIIFTILMMVASLALIRRTKEGQEVFVRWNAYRTGLMNADKRTLNMEWMSRHFIYATAFGLSQKQINKLFKKQDLEYSSLFPWIYFMPGSTHTPATAAASMSTLAATGMTSFAGTSGGIGATAGTAGGGASGGAG